MASTTGGSTRSRRSGRSSRDEPRKVDFLAEVEEHRVQQVLAAIVDPSLGEAPLDPPRETKAAGNERDIGSGVHLLPEREIPLRLRRSQGGGPDHPPVAQEHVLVGEMIVGVRVADLDLVELPHELAVSNVALPRLGVVENPAS